MCPVNFSPPQSCPITPRLEMLEICEMLISSSLAPPALRRRPSQSRPSCSLSRTIRWSQRSSSSLRFVSSLSQSSSVCFCAVEFLWRSWARWAQSWYLRMSQMTVMYSLQSRERVYLPVNQQLSAFWRMRRMFYPHSDSRTRKVGFRQSFFRTFCGCGRASLSMRCVRMASSGRAYLHFSRIAIISSFAVRRSSSILYLYPTLLPTDILLRSTGSARAQQLLIYNIIANAIYITAIYS